MNIKAEVKTLGTIFVEPSVFAIPPFQRNYSWKKDQVNEYWDDLMVIADSSSKGEYFLGQIILVRIPGSESNILILDGQQRLTTSMILMCVIFDYLSFETDGSDSSISKFLDHIKQHIYASTDKGLVPRLKLNRYDEPFFRSIYSQENFEIANLESHRLIKNAYENYYSKIHDEFSKSGFERLQNIFYVLRKQFVVAEISCQTIEDAHLLFESMNGKGLDLSKADLVKNLIFSKLAHNNDYDSVEEDWAEIIKNLYGKDITSFLMYFWSSKFEEIRKNQVFQVFKDKVLNQNNAKQIIEDLKKESKLFSYIQNPDEYPDKKVKKLLKELQLLNSDLSQILILAILSSCTNPNELVKYFKFLIAFLFRYSIICGGASNTLLPIFCKISQQLRRKTNAYNHFVDSLKPLLPSEDEFKREFLLFKARANTISKYILGKINDQKNPTKEYILNIEELHLEHIVPKAWEKDNNWKNEIKDSDLTTNGLDKKDFIHLIGNHTLLNDKVNMAFKNQSFSKKLNGDAKNIGYKKSQIPTTKDLSKYSKFTPKNIIDRQNSFFDDAVIIWNTNI
jgi:uncharacterized protein with ParB-like and HNH nuclease domain